MIFSRKLSTSNKLYYSATPPTKATQANSLQIDLLLLHVETIKIVTNELFLWCAACLDSLLVKNLLLKSKIFIHSICKEFALVALVGVVAAVICHMMSTER